MASLEVTYQVDMVPTFVTVVDLSSLYCQCPVPVLRYVVTDVALSSLSSRFPVPVLLFCVYIFLAVAFLTVTLSRICLIAVSF